MKIEEIRKITGLGELLKEIMTLEDLKELDIIPGRILEDYIKELEDYGYRFVLVE